MTDAEVIDYVSRFVSGPRSGYNSIEMRFSWTLGDRAARIAVELLAAQPILTAAAREETA